MRISIPSPLSPPRCGGEALRFFSDKEVKIEKIEGPGESQAEEHHWIVGYLKDDTHDHRTHARSQIGDCRKGTYGWTSRGTSTIEGINHQGGVEEGIPNSPDHCHKNEHRKGGREGKDDHRDDISGETRKDHLFSCIDIQYLSAKTTTQNEHESKSSKEETWIGNPTAQSIEREEC